jgi:hypothetical protein
MAGSPSCCMSLQGVMCLWDGHGCVIWVLARLKGNAAYKADLVYLPIGLQLPGCAGSYAGSYRAVFTSCPDSWPVSIGRKQVEAARATAYGQSWWHQH